MGFPVVQCNPLYTRVKVAAWQHNDCFQDSLVAGPRTTGGLATSGQPSILYRMIIDAKYRR
jgi:hypothetical protein